MNHLVRYLEERLLEWNLRRIADGRLAIDWHVSTYFHTQIAPHRVFTYHENLLKHVSTTSTVWEGKTSFGHSWRGNRQLALFSKCESGTLTGVDSGLYLDDRFNLDLCSNKVFSPCHVSKHTKIKDFPLFLTAIAGVPGKSCNIGCEKKGFTCKEEYFDPINRCDIMDMAYFNDGSVHECSRGDNHAYPLVDEGKIFIQKARPR